MPKIVIAPDKFKFSLTARQASNAIALGIGSKVKKKLIPLSDGGDGMLEVLIARPNMISTVTGPYGNTVRAKWHFSKGEAVIESAKVCGLQLVYDNGLKDPLNATTKGVGEVIKQAIDMGAYRIIVGIGGTATTDGGYAMITELDEHYRNLGVDVVALCDVRTKFLKAAQEFGPQKGASKNEVELLNRRLRALLKQYQEKYGINVDILRSGAGGGLAGGLYAFFGAELVDGAAYISQRKNLESELLGADLVITGEGRLDSHSFQGKVVGHVVKLANEMGVPVAVIAGSVSEGLTWDKDEFIFFSLSDHFGAERALNQAKFCLAEASKMLVEIFL